MHLKYKNAGKWEIKRGKRCTTQTLLIENWYASINQTEDLKPDVRERHFIIPPIFSKPLSIEKNLSVGHPPLIS